MIIEIMIGILLILGGLIETIAPETWYDWTEKWKNAKSPAWPSDEYIFKTRVFGILTILLGVIEIIVVIVLG